MGNRLQRLIYNISVAAPLALVLAFVWYQQLSTIVIPIILISISIILTVLLYLSFDYALKNIENTPFRATEVQPKDGWIIAYLATYLIPLVTIALDELNLLVMGALAVVLIVILSFINTAIPHPLLFFRGYHFYAVNSENGVSEYVLITKKKALRNTKHIKLVKRLFEYLLIEE